MSLPSNRHVLGRILLKRQKKNVSIKNESSIMDDDRVSGEVWIHDYSVWKDKKWLFSTSTAYDWCTYQLSSRYYNLLVRVFRADFFSVIEWSWSARRNRGPCSKLWTNFVVRSSYHILSWKKKTGTEDSNPSIRLAQVTGKATWYIRVLVSARRERNMSHTTAVSCGWELQEYQ